MARSSHVNNEAVFASSDGDAAAATPPKRQVWADAATKTRLFLLTSTDAARLAPGSFGIVSLDTGQQKKTSQKALAPFETTIAGLREEVEGKINAALGPALSALQAALGFPPADNTPREKNNGAEAPPEPLPPGAVLSEAEGAKMLLEKVARSLEAAGSGKGNHENARLALLVREEIEKLPLGETPLPSLALPLPEGIAGFWEEEDDAEAAAPLPDVREPLPTVDVAYILAAFDEMPETG